MEYMAQATLHNKNTNIMFATISCVTSNDHGNTIICRIFIIKWIFCYLGYVIILEYMIRFPLYSLRQRMV